MTTSDSTTDPDATATLQNGHRRVTVERYGEQVIINGPRDGTVELEAPDEAEATAGAIQAIIPKAWKA